MPKGGLREAWNKRVVTNSYKLARKDKGHDYHVKLFEWTFSRDAVNEKKVITYKVKL